MFNYTLDSCDKPAIGDDSHTRTTSKCLHIDREVDTFLQIWDISREISFAGTMASACVIVYDINDEKSFKNVKKWRSIFFENINAGDAAKQNIALLLLANKCDLKKNNDFEKASLLTSGYCKLIETKLNIFIPADIARIIIDYLIYLMSAAFCHESKYKDMLFYEVSALNGKNVEQAFKAIATECVKRHYFAPAA